MMQPLNGRQLLGRLLSIPLIAGGLSLIFGHFFAIFSGMLLLLLIWHYWQLLKLSHWIWRDRQLYPPEGRGSWQPIFHGLHRMRRDQRRSRQRLAAILKYFRRGAEAMPDAIILCDRDGRLQWCNPEAAHLLGLRWPHDEQNSLFNLIRDPALVDYFERGEYASPYLLHRQQRELECRFYYPYLEDNLLIMVRDMTDRTLAERTRQSFFANVNHELRIPLTVIQGYVEMLNMEARAPFEAHALARIDEQVARLRHLVEELMLLTRLETARELQRSERFDLALLLHEIVNDYQESQHASPRNEDERSSASTLSDAHVAEDSPPSLSATIRRSIEPNLWVEGDRSQLTKVVTNLLYNAIEHNPPGVMIELMAIKGEAITVSIRDNGAGIGAEHLEKLTDRFYRVDSSRSRHQSGGSGLGLAIVKHVLQNHGASLTIESVIGEGSCFTFQLPYASATTLPEGE